MSKFYTAFNPGKKEPSPAGEHIQIEHRLEIDKNGKSKLIWDKPVDIYSMIQANKEETEIEYIMRRATEGDPSILNMVNGQYMDVTDLPKTLAKAQQLVIEQTNKFMDLPWEIRREYNNDPQEYFLDIGSKKWQDLMGVTEAEEQKRKLEEAQKAEAERNAKAMENLANLKLKEVATNE